MAADRALIQSLRETLGAAGDPVRAVGQQAYMKSAMPYYGITSAPLRDMCKACFKDHPLTGETAWRETVLALWDDATHREERYAAIQLTGVARYRPHQAPGALPIYEHMITTGAWWDYVDEVAVHRVGPLLQKHRDVMRPVLLEWSTSTDLWKRRASIVADRDFFIRKAIGWALRSYAWHEPGFVSDFVSRREASLSGLSRREALRNIR
jgi:3-methyladenine DNA glycosylase AlkD